VGRALRLPSWPTRLLPVSLLIKGASQEGPGAWAAQCGVGHTSKMLREKAISISSVFLQKNNTSDTR
jgi:hypothetical protein